MTTVQKRCLLFLLLLGLFWAGSVWLSPSGRLRAAQAAFLKAVSAKDAEAVQALLADDYGDQWGYSRDEWPDILADLRTLAPVFEVTGDLAPGGEAGEMEGVLHFSASGSPAAGYVIDETGDWEAPTRFLWKRIDWRPWSWRLQRIENPDIDLPAGYQPGRGF